MTDVISDQANDRTNHRSFLEFRENVKISVKGQRPWLGCKFRGPWKTVGLSAGPSYLLPGKQHYPVPHATALS